MAKKRGSRRRESEKGDQNARIEVGVFLRKVVDGKVALYQEVKLDASDEARKVLDTVAHPERLGKELRKDGRAQDEKLDPSASFPLQSDVGDDTGPVGGGEGGRTASDEEDLDPGTSFPIHVDTGDDTGPIGGGAGATTFEAGMLFRVVSEETDG